MVTATVLGAAAFALFLWWFCTGLILFLDRLPPHTYGLSLAGASLVLVAALWGLRAMRDVAGSISAYGAFGCALLVWGWIEMAFLMGFVAGPRTTPCTVEAMGWKRARQAFETIAYHELAIVLGFVVIAAITFGAENRIGLWTFVLLWGCRQSAKLNVFLGARNLGEQFLPEHLRYLHSYFLRRTINPLFPLSVAGLAIALVVLVELVIDADDEFTRTGYTLLATLSGLALIEHLFLMLPVSLDQLWTWSLRGRGVRAELAGGVNP